MRWWMIRVIEMGRVRVWIRVRVLRSIIIHSILQRLQQRKINLLQKRRQCKMNRD